MRRACRLGHAEQLGGVVYDDPQVASGAAGVGTVAEGAARRWVTPPNSHGSVGGINYVRIVIRSFH